jgi:hypothetical protein
VEAAVSIETVAIVRALWWLFYSMLLLSFTDILLFLEKVGVYRTHNYTVQYMVSVKDTFCSFTYSIYGI